MEKVFQILIAIHMALCLPAPIKKNSAKTIDLTYAFDSNTIYWPNANNFTHKITFRGYTKPNQAGFYYEANDYGAAEHGGTHLDAPSHFCDPGGPVKCWRTDEVPVERLQGEGVVLDASPLIFNTSSPSGDFQLEAYQLTVLISAWEQSHGREIPNGAFILIHTGWGRFWEDEERYLGNRVKDASDLHFPGLHPNAASWLLEHHPTISMVGIDTASMDFGGSSEFMAHQILLGANIPQLENVANLDKLLQEEEESGLENSIQIFALPMKIRGGSGGPTRVIALLKSTASSSASTNLFSWR